MGHTTPSIEQAEKDLAACIARAEGWDGACDRAATHLSELMVRANMRRREMVRRLRALGLAWPAARELVSHVCRELRSRRQEAQEAQFANATPLCPHCLHPIDRLTHFCPNCAGPVSVHASIDPLKRIYTMGWGYRNAVSGKPRLSVVIGMWLIFGPVFVWKTFILLDALKDGGLFGSPGRGFPADSRWDLGYDLYALGFICASCAFSAVILYKVTARWLRRCRQTQ